MSLDRPLLLSGWDPRGRPLRPQRYRDHETAQHVVHLLRACGFRVTLIPTVPDDTGHDEERGSRGLPTTAGNDRRGVRYSLLEEGVEPS
ncbi:MAG TPA: hypothetical protein VJ755_02495 [Gemmatimonadales bacterium]|nr:hypothetical protein [Gemmatimonadales bacterium]